MLVELKVSNFAIIDSVHIEFEQGFNVLSGETGAGKSVLLKSLALMMGDKATTDTVRSGAEQAVVEGVFDLSSRKDTLQALDILGISADDDLLVVRRVIHAQGRSRVYLNGSICALSSLRSVVAPLIELAGPSEPLIEMTGQHDTRHLFSAQYQLDLLDRYAGTWNLRKEVAALFSNWKNIESRILEIQSAAQSRSQRLDFLTFQKEELETLNLTSEDNELESKLKRMKNSSKLVHFINSSESALYSDEDSVLVRLHRVLQEVQELSRWDESLPHKTESLSQAKALIEEAVFELREYAKDFELNPEELEANEARLSRIRQLEKKHGEGVLNLMEVLKNLEIEVQGLEHSDETLDQLKEESKMIMTRLLEMSEELHHRRSQGAELLTSGVNDELLDLNMKGVHFQVQLQELSEVGPMGSTAVEFQILSGKQEAPRAIAKTASGGELSRILLSIKRIVGQSDFPRTFLFDEVDTGVSGPTAEKVGRKLRSISKGQQVICVTHLPQVAAQSDCHFLIFKDGDSQTQVTKLKQKDRVQEIARLISGETITKTSLGHAKQLLESHNSK